MFKHTPPSFRGVSVSKFYIVCNFGSVYLVLRKTGCLKWFRVFFSDRAREVWSFDGIIFWLADGVFINGWLFSFFVYLFWGNFCVHISWGFFGGLFIFLFFGLSRLFLLQPLQLCSCFFCFFLLFFYFCF